MFSCVSCISSNVIVADEGERKPTPKIRDIKTIRERISTLLATNANSKTKFDLSQLAKKTTDSTAPKQVIISQNEC